MTTPDNDAARADKRMKLSGGLHFEGTGSFKDGFALKGSDGKHIGPQFWHGSDARRVCEILQSAEIEAEELAHNVGYESGYAAGVQDADVRTGGDGEYVASLGSGGRHCPDPASMLARMSERCATLSAHPLAPEVPAGIGEASLVDSLKGALLVAEAALADIGDADREPGDDVAWCERRAAEALSPVRAALARPKTEEAGRVCTSPARLITEKNGAHCAHKVTQSSRRGLMRLSRVRR